MAAAVADKPLKAVAVGAWPDGLYIANPPTFNVLAKCVELGVDFVVPENPDQNGYWELLSWENIDKYGADAIFLDIRTGGHHCRAAARRLPDLGGAPGGAGRAGVRLERRARVLAHRRCR